MKAATALLVGALALGAPPLPAQVQEPEAPTVYLMTMGPGKYVWERFGHNALWIHDPVHGTDLTYNYGLFDFRQENFLLRFVQGRMLYWMDGAPVDRYLWLYRHENRSIWVQELNLEPEARRELQAFLEWNARPENRYYRYDYYRDNCSTRVRDALDRVVAGQLRAQTESVKVAATYRFHTERLTTNDIPIYTGLLAALGPAVDRPLSAWEEMFLPLAMREHVRNVTVPGPDGHDIPLVKAEQTVFESTLPLPPATPPNWLIWYLAVGVVLGGGIVVLGRQAATSRAARRAFLVAATAWAAIIGILGTVLAGLWLATDHVVAYHNENLFQLNPLPLALAVLLPAAALGARWAQRPLWWCAASMAALSVVGLVIQILPGFDQVNGPIIALILPMHLGVAVAVRAFAAQSETVIPSIAASTVSPGAVRRA